MLVIVVQTQFVIMEYMVMDFANAKMDIQEQTVVNVLSIISDRIVIIVNAMDNHVLMVKLEMEHVNVELDLLGLIVVNV